MRIDLYYHFNFFTIGVVDIEVHEETKWNKSERWSRISIPDCNLSLFSQLEGSCWVLVAKEWLTSQLSKSRIVLWSFHFMYLLYEEDMTRAIRKNEKEKKKLNLLNLFKIGINLVRFISPVPKFIRKTL